MLNVNNLTVSFSTPEGSVQAVNNLSFDISEGETLAIVGESGSGKSQTVLSIMGLLAQNGDASGEAIFAGQNLINMPAKELNKVRGADISMIFQDPMTCLNPYMTIGKQMIEVLELHQNMDKKTAWAKALEMLDKVQIPDAKSRINQYAHEFSGGMRQRVMIAMALLCNPKVLIADEPTTALDVTVQAQINRLMRQLNKETNTSIILITHDLGVVAGLCDKVLVMYAGEMVEYGTVDEIFHKPAHPYTRGLLRSVPRLDKNSLQKLLTIPGNPPNLLALKEGCHFYPRCNSAQASCKKGHPPLQVIDGEHTSRCYLKPEELKA